MKKIIVIGILVGRWLALEAQYVPNSSQPFQFASLYNPAFTGVEPYTDFRLGYRDQWSGFGANAPKFINLACNFRLNQPLDLTLNAMRTSISQKEREVPKRKKIIQAVGVNVFDEEVGIVGRVGGGVNYSVHYPVSKKVNLATGVSIMVENTKLKLNEVYMGNTADQDPLYDRLVRSGVNQTDLNIRAGILIYSSHFYFGVSYLPLFHSSIQHSGGDFTETSYRGTAQTGVSFSVSPSIDLKPSLVVLVQSNNQLLIDYNLKVYFQRKVWSGLTYRNSQNGVAMLGLDLSDLLSVAYAYEVSTGTFRQFSDGSHELVVGMRLNNFKHLRSQVW